MSTLLNIVTCALISATTAYGQDYANEVDNTSEQTWHPFGKNIAFTLSDDIVNHNDFYTLRFLLNGNDITALVLKQTETKFVLMQDLIQHPSGQHELSVFKENLSHEAELLNTYTVNILSPLGFEQSEIAIQGSLTLSTQKSTETQREQALGSIETTTNELETSRSQVDLQLTLNTEHKRNNNQLTSHANLVGTSFQQNALQFSQAQEDADKVDLSDYLVSASSDKLRLQVGHRYAGTNSLLFDNIGNRGLHIGYQFNSYIDIALHQQNGSEIVGWQNILGQQNSQHRLRSAVISTEVFPEEQGKLRVELSYLNANTLAIDDFAVGEVSNIEKSQGWGLKLSGQLLENSLRYEVNYAKSTFRHPQDDALSFFEAENEDLALDIVPTQDKTSDAYFAKIDYVIWPNASELDSLFSANLTLQHERYDALYKSIGANAGADLDKNLLTLSGHLSKANWQYTYLRFRNNVDNIPSILTTQTRSHDFIYSLNLADEFGDTGEVDPTIDSIETDDENTELRAPFWHEILPTINLHVQNTHQYAINNPSEDISDFNSESHLPDQESDLVNLSLDWNFDTYNIGYVLSYAFQDNKQLGRENADFTILNHIIRQQINVSPTISVSLELARARNADIELDQVLYQNNGLLDINVSVFDKWTLNLNASKNRDYDNLASNLQKAFTLGMNVQYQWQSHFYSQQYTGSWHIRFAKQQNASVDNQFNIYSQLQNWHIHSGISLSF